MDADALAPMEDLDCSRGDPHVDIGADERVRDRIQEVMDLDVVIEIDARAAIPRTPNRRRASR